MQQIENGRRAVPYGAKCLQLFDQGLQEVISLCVRIACCVSTVPD